MALYSTLAPSREMMTIELSVELKNLVLWIAGFDTVNVTSCFKAFTLCFLLASQYCRLAFTWSVWKEQGGVSHVLHFPVFLARLSSNSYVTNVILTSGVSVDLKYFFIHGRLFEIPGWRNGNPKSRSREKFTRTQRRCSRGTSVPNKLKKQWNRYSIIINSLNWTLNSAVNCWLLLHHGHFGKLCCRNWSTITLL